MVRDADDAAAVSDHEDELDDKDDGSRDVRIDIPAVPPRDAARGGTAIRLGVACMTKKPDYLETWLQHHVDALGVVRFYLRIEDTPELGGLLGRDPWKSLVRAKFVTRPTARDWHGQTQRQSTHVLSLIHI